MPFCVRYNDSLFLFVYVIVESMQALLVLCFFVSLMVIIYGSYVASRRAHVDRYHAHKTLECPILHSNVGLFV